MPVIDIILDGDNAFKELQGQKILHGELIKVATLKDGMKSGLPSVALLIKIDLGEHAGEYVIAETSLKLFQAANAAFTGRFGDVT